MNHDVAVLGVGMHPWGKWGRPFVEYGVHAARAALADSGIDWSDVDFVVGGETVRNGYAGYVAGASIAQALGSTAVVRRRAAGPCGPVRRTARWSCRPWRPGEPGYGGRSSTAPESPWPASA